MKISNIPVVHQIVKCLKCHGVNQVVISPGSRNAPLTLSFANDPFFDCHSVVDERSAAFIALGMAQQAQKAVVLVCTSGSALLNYYPAVAEAFYSNIPLIVISADRPPHKIDIGDGQTIRQENVFQNHIGFSANLKLDITRITQKADSTEEAPDEQKSINGFNEALLEKAILTNLTINEPVHINVPFEEPLYDLLTLVDQKSVPKAPQVPTNLEFPDYNWASLKKEWAASKKKMVLVGSLQPNSIREKWLNNLAADPTVLVLHEVQSNIPHPNFIPHIDTILVPLEKSGYREDLVKALQPDILLSLGGMIVSKKIKSFLRKFKPRVHWQVHPYKKLDTFFSLDTHFKMGANGFLEKIGVDDKASSGNYRDHWLSIKNQYLTQRTDFVSNCEFSDFWVFSKILSEIPETYQLHLSNSSTIRYCQLFDVNLKNGVFCNRGTSGIEGSSSTAVGAARNAASPTLLITGDLAFFYDSNAFWNHLVRNDFRIIVINNGGGGIFRILPGFDGSKKFEDFFETTHQKTAKSICLDGGINYLSASDKDSLASSLRSFFEIKGSPQLLEIFTPRKLNDKILISYFNIISSDFISSISS